MTNELSLHYAVIADEIITEKYDHVNLGAKFEHDEKAKEKKLVSDSGYFYSRCLAWNSLGNDFLRLR